MRIVSSGVKAIKLWPWLMRWFESLIKSLIEPNAPTVLRPMCFRLIYHQLLDQHNIAINLLNLCPFPEPNSRVLELYAHSFSSSILQSVDSSQEKKFVGHPIRTHHPHVLKLQPVTLLVDRWTLWSTFSTLIKCIMLRIFIICYVILSSSLDLTNIFTWWILGRDSLWFQKSRSSRCSRTSPGNTMGILVIRDKHIYFFAS